MSATHSPKLLLKIVTGTAWIDGKVQIEEQDYLKRIATKHNLNNDPELKPLINGLKPVSQEQCYQWVEEYLGRNPSQAAQDQLLEAVSGLIYSDGTVDGAEAQLLNEINDLKQADDPIQSFRQKIIQKLQKVYAQISEI